jgi:NAD(P)-dependent dehydrogenase (short-subunit alcohol dehydrogenase family)
VGLLRQKRVRLTAAPLDAADFEGGADRLPRRWILTGGARGITAEVAKRLASLYRPALHLVGRQALPSEAELAELRALGPAGLEAKKRGWLEELRPLGAAGTREFAARSEALEKLLEIDRNLREIAALGSEVHYHPVDLGDRGAVQALLEQVRGRGEIEGLIHGAGVEIAKPFAKKTAEIMGSTLAGKVDGLVHLLALTAEDPLSHLVAFSSVSGRFGGHGQADYSAANEMLSRITGAFRRARPAVRASAITWPAWDEVGLAARSSAKAFLTASGQRLMPPREGTEHLLRELWSGLAEPEVIIAERLEALDLDRILVADEDLPSWREAIARGAALPLLGAGNLIVSGRERVVIERRLLAGEPFLDQHRMGPTPILPAVIALELLVELACLDGDRWTLGDFTIHQPLKIAEGQSLLIRLERSGDQLRLLATARRPDGVVLDLDRPYASARRVPRRPLPPRNLPRWPGEGVPYPYPERFDNNPGSRMIFHGPVFRCLEAVAPIGADGGLARLVVPPVEALAPGSDPEAWRLPSALLDGSLQAAGVLGRILFGATALPIGMGRVDAAARAVRATGETVLLEIRQQRQGDELVSDLYAASGGEPLFWIEGYRAQILRKP